MTSFLRLVPLSLLCLAPFAVQAQERVPERPADSSDRAPARRGNVDVPREMLPPAGKCRIWMDGVTPSQQPAPTDCQTALRQRPANGTVVFGPATKDAPVRGFAAPRTTRDTLARPTRTARPSSTTTPTRTDSSSRRRRPERPS